MKTSTSIATPSNSELVLKSSPARPLPCFRHLRQCAERRGGFFRGMAALVALAIFGATAARAVDFHVATAQDLQNALTTAAANGAANNIWLTNGYYTGNFNFNSAGGYNLLIANEPNVTNNAQIIIDGAGTGRDMNLASSGIGSITVNGLTFLRNCGSTSIGALRVAAGANANVLVQNCQFLSPTNTSGMGLEFSSGLNDTITNCTILGTTNSGFSRGVFISGVTNVRVQNCTFVTNSVTGCYITGASVVGVTNSLFSGNYSDGPDGYSADPVGYNGNINGAGVYCSGTTITLSGNTFINNLAGGYVHNSGNFGYGGGAYCSGTTVTLAGNNFNQNSTVLSGLGSGGGAYCNGTTILISGNTFTGNKLTTYSANFGGGGVFCSGLATLTGNSFSGNSTTTSGNGGGVFCTAASTLTANNFSGNTSGGSGGGIYCSGGIFIVSSNTFSQNTAPTGGGLYVTGPTVILQDNLVVNNSQTNASLQGGGIWVNATSNLFMINNTVFGNTAYGSGGGAAFQVNGTVELLNIYNNIIWGNSAGSYGADVYLAGTGQKKVFLNNDVNNMYGVWDIAQSVTNVDPQFFNAVGGDYHLQSTSPCRNAGTNGAPSLPLTDLDGNARTNLAGLVDLGCYEFNTTATHPADTNGDFVITPAEYAAYAAAWKAGQSWSNAPAAAPNPNPISADYVTRAGYLMTNGTGHYTNDGSARPTNWKIAP